MAHKINSIILFIPMWSVNVETAICTESRGKESLNIFKTRSTELDQANCLLMWSKFLTSNNPQVQVIIIQIEWIFNHPDNNLTDRQLNICER